MMLEARVSLIVTFSALLAVVWGWQPPHQVDRRQAIGAAVTAALVPPFPASAAAAEDDFLAFQADPFRFEIPKSWKVIVKPTKQQQQQQPKDGKLFSALDFGTGAVLTVVQENICSREEYALNEKQRCDLVGNNSNNDNGVPSPLFGEATLSRDVTKLLRRQTTSTKANNNNNNKVITTKVFATTSIPTGGTYKDRMGLDQPYLITRNVQSQVLVDNDKVYSLWLSAPSDEWRKPLVGTRLLQVWASVEVN